MDEKEVVGMTDKQFETVLKQILLYAKKAENKEEIIKYLEEMMADDKKARPGATGQAKPQGEGGTTPPPLSLPFLFYHYYGDVARGKAYGRA